MGQGEQRPAGRLRAAGAASPARALAAFDPATIARIFAAYEDVKLERGRIDLEDVLLCAVALLAEDERVAAEIRRQYRTFVVDEYQDVSPAAAEPARPVARRPRGRLRGRRPGADHLLVGRRRPGEPGPLRVQRHPDGDRDQAGPRLPVDAADRGRGEQGPRRGRSDRAARPGHAAVPEASPARLRSTASTPTRSPRRTRSPGPSHGSRTRARRCATSPYCSGRTRSRRTSSRRWPSGRSRPC